MDKTVIEECTCKHEFQDKQYGKNRRVFNVGKEGAKITCTSCGKVKTRFALKTKN